MNSIVGASLLKEQLRSVQIAAGYARLSTTLGVEPKALIQDVPTRWFSTYSMVERAVLLKQHMRAVLDGAGRLELFPTEGVLLFYHLR